jgi:hypothetical protein
MNFDAQNFAAFRQKRDELLIDYGICINIIAIRWQIFGEIILPFLIMQSF